VACFPAEQTACGSQGASEEEHMKAQLSRYKATRIGVCYDREVVMQEVVLLETVMVVVVVLMVGNRGGDHGGRPWTWWWSWWRWCWL